MPVSTGNVLIYSDILPDMNTCSIFVPKDKFTSHKIYNNYSILIVRYLPFSSYVLGSYERGTRAIFYLIKMSAR